MMYDDNGRPFSSLDAYNVAICRPTPFNSAVTNARGDFGGTDAAHTLFTVTGDVFVRLWGVCTVDLVSAGAGTVSVGVTGNTAGLIALETATEIDATGLYVSATQVIGTVAVSSIPGPFVIANGLDIIETTGTADISAGNIYYVCLWRPVSEGQSAAGVSIEGLVAAAGTQL